MTRPIRRQIYGIGRRRAWLIWAVGLSVYTLAVFHRTSLGVASLLAADRFHITAGQLSIFTVLQLTVYAAMQVPVGVLLGARLAHSSTGTRLAGVPVEVPAEHEQTTLALFATSPDARAVAAWYRDTRGAVSS